MGSNMQRQAVPLLVAEPPIVGTGMERAVAEKLEHGYSSTKSWHDLPTSIPCGSKSVTMYIHSRNTLV